MVQAVGMASTNGSTGAIFHIAFERDWQHALERGSYEISTRGRTLDEVGFIHAGFERQVAAVGSAFYADVPEPLVVLVIDPDQLESRLVVEDVEGSDDAFPHIYGPLNPGAVVQVYPASVTDDGFAFGDGAS
jgi:uncharacterized protein (DUF952 family)